MEEKADMSKECVYLNGPAAGIILKEAVWRALCIAREEVLKFEVNAKTGYGGKMDDVFTSADRRAQESYVRTLRECFPKIGIIGEEDSLVIPAADGVDAYFTIDPLDGTKAYVRKQSHGVGSMVALVVDGVVVSAYIGDTNSQEIFGYRPDSTHVWRLRDMRTPERLDENPAATPVDRLHILLRERERDYSPWSQRTIDVFKSISIDGGSIGIWSARLWKGEVGGLLLPPSWETPWDSTPIIGISRKLGYIFLRPVQDDEGEGWCAYEPVLPKEKFRRDHDTLIIHGNQIDDLGRYMRVISPSDH